MEKLKKEICQEPTYKKNQSNQSKNWKILENNVKTNAITKYLSQTTNEKAATNEPISPKDWPKEKVQEWLKTQDIDPSIITLVKEFNGEMICELNAIRNTASEYFYSSISQHNKIELNEVVRFSNILRKFSS